MIYRAIHFLLLFILGIFVTPLISLPVAFFYAMRYFAPELILVGYLFDVYFGALFDFPYYTLVAGLIILSTEIAKRFLMLQ